MAMETVTTSSIGVSSKYVRDFDSLFVPINVNTLRDKARHGQLRHSQFRSLCWRYFLRCLPDQHSQWIDYCNKSRLRYEEVRSRHSARIVRKLSDETNNAISVQSNTTEPQQTHIEHSSGFTPITSPSSVASSSTTTTTTTTVTKDDKNKTTSLDKDNIISISAINSKKIDDEERQYIKAANDCDHKNVYRTIERDVVRTFPDMEFFRQSEMQSILENVLFNYASENPHLSYKQGMHELLATLLYVVHTDSQTCLINHQGGYANEFIAHLLDLKYLEHDVFHLFCALMKSIETWYQNDEILVVPELASNSRANNSSGSSGSSGGSANSNRYSPAINNNKSSSRYSSPSNSNRQQVSSVLSIKLKMISENILKNYDLELFNHLEALQIAPQIYGIRWMRLLFGREFEFLDLLTVWDAIICDTVSMSLTEYMFASMLITIREELVNGDYTDCLNNLMRYQFKDVSYVIRLALYLRDPKNHNRPMSPSISTSNLNRYNRLLPHNRFHTQNKPSLTSKLSQQYITAKQQIANRNYNPFSSVPNTGYSTSQVPNADSTRRYSPKMNSPKPSSSTNIPLKSIGSGSAKALNISTESYDDLHSIVDYCWRLLSEQIDSLQKCLPKEKSLHCEDEIFVALAQLKKVRDVLKGSLRLEDELEAQPSGSNS